MFLIIDYIICDFILDCIILDCIFDKIICDCIYDYIICNYILHYIVCDCLFDYIICDCIFTHIICDWIFDYIICDCIHDYIIFDCNSNWIICYCIYWYIICDCIYLDPSLRFVFFISSFLFGLELTRISFPVWTRIAAQTGNETVKMQKIVKLVCQLIADLQCSGKVLDKPRPKKKCPNAVIVITNLLQILRMENIKLRSMDTKQNTYVSLSIFDWFSFHPLEYWLVFRYDYWFPMLGLVYLKFIILEKSFPHA